MRTGFDSAETQDECERVDPHGWTTPKEAVVLFVTTKRRSCPLMPQFTCRAAEPSMGMGLMTVSSKQGPTTCHDLVRLSAFFPAQLFRILVTLGQRPLPVSIPHYTCSGDFPSHRSLTCTRARHPQPAWGTEARATSLCLVSCFPNPQ